MSSTRRTSHPTWNIFGDFSDISLENAKMEDIRNLKFSRSLAKIAPSHSGFLKRNQNYGCKILPKEKADVGSGRRLFSPRCPTTPWKLRANVAPMKMASSDTESDPRNCEDSLPASAEIKCPRDKPGKPLSWRAGGAVGLWRTENHPWKVYPLKRIFGKRGIFEHPKRIY